MPSWSWQVWVDTELGGAMRHLKSCGRSKGNHQDIAAEWGQPGLG